MADSEYKTIVKDGLWDNNGVFSMLLGMCPTMAMTTSATNGFGMGLATAVVMAAGAVHVTMGDLVGKRGPQAGDGDLKVQGFSGEGMVGVETDRVPLDFDHPS